MSNDNKTLADAQPGGRVRLPDQAERARFEAFLSRNPLMALCAGTAWQVWQAALSAQPSPGGQGDALREAAEFARSVLAEIYATYQVKIGPFASQAQLANVKLGAALAATGKQQVGDKVWCGACWPHGINHEEGCIREQVGEVQGVDLKWLAGSIDEVAHRLRTYMPHLAEWADRARDCSIAAKVLAALAARQPEAK